MQLVVKKLLQMRLWNYKRTLLTQTNSFPRWLACVWKGCHLLEGSLAMNHIVYRELTLSPTASSHLWAVGKKTIEDNCRGEAHFTTYNA